MRLKEQIATGLMRRIDYQFSDLALLELALSHRSLGSTNYERLEYLGDSILGFVVAEWLYETYPDLAEGRLSRMRAMLVRKESLAEIARDLDIGDALLLGEGELKSGGFNRSSILADVVESIIGAIYIDSGLQDAKTFIQSNFAKAFARISTQETHKDAKSQLQEVLQKRSLPLPDYQIVSTTGQQHEQIFTVSCELVELDVRTEATSSTRRGAEQMAAQQALEQL